MKTAKSVWFKDLTPEQETQYLEYHKAYEYKRRLESYGSSPDESTLPYYFKADYIENWKPGNIIVNFCPDCGQYVNLATFVKEVGFYERTVTMRCQCGCMYEYHG